MRDNPDLPFGTDEYRNRLGRVLDAMGREGLDGLMIHSPENIYYLTGYHSVGYFTYSALVLSVSGGATMVIRALMEKMVEATSWVEDIQAWSDLQDPVSTTREALEHQGLLGKAVGYDAQAWFYNIGHHQALSSLCGSTTFKDAVGLVEEARKVKSPREVEYIRRAVKTCEAAIKGAIEAIAEGATENDVAAAAYYNSIKAGSEYLGHAMLIATGRRAGLGFTTWERAPIQRGDLVYLEMGGSYKRYNGCLSRAAALGEPSDMAKRLVEGSREALERAVSAVRPGVTSAEVDRAARDYLANQGLSEHFKHRTGYFIGIGFPPDWGEGRIASINEGDPTVLEPGMVFHLIPDLRIDGEMGTLYSDTVLVTEGGHEVLSNYPRELVIK
ncbi:MAG: Xaa-Pro peptidase family protein [Dehalococcoidia bacterium]